MARRARARAQEAGTWSGWISQPGYDPYDVVIVLDGRGGGRTDYPSDACSGSLSGGPGTYRETITVNRMVEGQPGGCIDSNISVRVSGDSLTVYWSGTWLGETFTASATLQRRR